MDLATLIVAIPDIAQLLTAIFVGSGVWVAYRQLGSWRDERREALGSDTAIELLVSAFEASDILKSLRSPFDSLPKEKERDKSYIYEKRIERFNAAQPVFARLRKNQIKAFALLHDTEIDKAVDILFEVRSRTIVAIQSLADRSDYEEEDPETRKMYQELRRDMWGLYSEKSDPLGMKQLAALQELGVLLRPKIDSSQRKVRSRNSPSPC